MQMKPNEWFSSLASSPSIVSMFQASLLTLSHGVKSTIGRWKRKSNNTIRNMCNLQNDVTAGGIDGLYTARRISGINTEVQTAEETVENRLCSRLRRENGSLNSKIQNGRTGNDNIRQRELFSNSKLESAFLFLLPGVLILNWNWTHECRSCPDPL